MSTPANWFSNSVAWLDSKGKGAWIAAMIAGFVFVWPVGLFILFYMLWSNRMCSKFFGTKSPSLTTDSGNSAFENYKQDTLRRLSDEQTAFSGFMQRLREAKDKSEFDDFMNERAKKMKKANA